MDPLSEVLSLLKPRGAHCHGIDIANDLVFRFPAHHGIKCYAVVSGRCWLMIEGLAEPILLKAGSCFLLPRGAPISVGSSLAANAVDALRGATAAKSGSVTTFNGGGACFVIGGYFTVDGTEADALLKRMPPIVQVSTASRQADFRWALECMRRELYEEQPGAQLIAQQLGHMILVQTLRIYLQDQPHGRAGWFLALGNEEIRGALTAIHASPAEAWTVEDLARRAGMSRSLFSRRFKEISGETPMEYLTRWRMLLAAERLRATRDPISQIATDAGYASEASFRLAFKNLTGRSPRRYSKQEACGLRTDS